MSRRGRDSKSDEPGPGTIEGTEVGPLPVRRTNHRARSSGPIASKDQERTPRPGEDRTPRHPLEGREYEGRRHDEHHHTNLWMNRHGEEGGGHRGGSHPEDA